MSINIGNPAIQSIRELRGNPHFEHLVAHLGVEVQKFMLSAQKSEVSVRVDQTAYARGMYELWVAVHAAHTDQLPSQVKPPAPMDGKGKRVTLNETMNEILGNA